MNAAMVKASGMAMPVFGGLALACAMAVLLLPRSAPAGSRRGRRALAAFGITGAAGFLLSTVMLYVGYRPYSKAFERLLLGDRSHLQELSSFLVETQKLFGNQSRELFGTLSLYPTHVAVYFWTGVTLVCVLGLLILVARFLLNRHALKATA